MTLPPSAGGPRPQVFSVAAGFQPAVEPGIHPPQCNGGFSRSRQIVDCPWHHLFRIRHCYGGRVLPGGLSRGLRRHLRVQSGHSRAARCRPLRQPRWLPLRPQADAKHVLTGPERQCRNPNDETGDRTTQSISTFGLRISFVIGYSSFGFQNNSPLDSKGRSRSAPFTALRCRSVPGFG